MISRLEDKPIRKSEGWVWRVPVSLSTVWLPCCLQWDSGVLPETLRRHRGLGLTPFYRHQVPLSSLTWVLEELTDRVGAPWASEKLQRWWPSFWCRRRKWDKGGGRSPVPGGRWCLLGGAVVGTVHRALSDLERSPRFFQVAAQRQAVYLLH